MICPSLAQIARQAASTARSTRVSGEPILDQINLVVSDMDASVAFYRRLGLNIPDTEPDFQSHHRSAQLPGGVDFDIDSVEFARHWDKGWRSGGGVIGFQTLEPRGRRQRVLRPHLSGIHRAARAVRRLLGCALRHCRGPRWQPCRAHEPRRSQSSEVTRLSLTSSGPQMADSVSVKGCTGAEEADDRGMFCACCPTSCATI